MDKKNNWTDSLPELFEGYTEAAPEGLWDAVQAGLAPAKRRIAPVWWISGSLAAAAAVVLAIVLWPDTVPGVSGEEQARLAQNEILVPNTDEPLLTEQVPEDPATGSMPEADGRRYTAASPARYSAPTSSQNAAASDIDAETTDIAQEAGNSNGSDDAGLADTIPDKETDGVSVGLEENETEGEAAVKTLPEETASVGGQKKEVPGVRPIEEQIRKKYRGGVQLALLSDGCLSPGQISQASGFGLVSQPGLAPQTRASDGGAAYSGVNLFMMNRNKSSVLESEHSQSARWQLGLHYHFLPRWGTETGLALTRLNSRFESTSGQSRSVTHRQTSYLGIPLYMHFDVFQWHRLSLYLQAGPMFEFALDTQSTRDDYLGGSLWSSESSTDLVEDRIWSLNAGAGLQFRLFRYGAIFVQPNFSWHFAGPDHPETYYSTHPAAVSLSLGYRVLLH